jgi:hypothetical protein
MKRSLGLLAVVSMLVGIPLSHVLLAEKPGDVPRGKDRIEICHIDEFDEGHFIEVAEPAVQAHLDHGDCLDAEPIDPPIPEVGECQCD